MRKTKKLNQFIITTGMAITIMVMPLSSYAQTTGITNKIIDRINTQEKTGSIAAQLQGVRLIDLKTKADKAITNRITSLNNLLTKITNAKRLSDTEKASLIAQVQSYITNLTSLKTKIDADTDITTLKTDVQSIVESYRVYAFFMPQMEILSIANGILTTTQQISSASSQLQTIIQNAKNQGKDTTNMQSMLTDMQNKVNDANTQAQNAITTVTGLTPTGYPDNKTFLQTARSSILNARQDLTTAVQDIKNILQSTKTQQSTTPNLSPTPTI